ncbi:Uncharacterised protein [Burkholderia pseudomallei]|nr:Uncharacterised protein [Burkholderia pseudomallei]
MPPPDWSPASHASAAHPFPDRSPAAHHPTRPSAPGTRSASDSAPSRLPRTAAQRTPTACALPPSARSPADHRAAARPTTPIPRSRSRTNGTASTRPARRSQTMPASRRTGAQPARARPSPPSADPSSPTCRSHRQGGAHAAMPPPDWSPASHASAAHPFPDRSPAAHHPTRPTPRAPPRPPAPRPAGCPPRSRAGDPTHMPDPAAHTHRPPSGSPAAPPPSRFRVPRKARPVGPGPRRAPADSAQAGSLGR